KLNQVRTLLKVEKNYEDSNTIFSRMRSLKLAESYALNGVKLHELYFENIIGPRKLPSGPIVTDIVATFGSLEYFLMKFKAVGLSMRGWAVLSWDPLDDGLHIYGQDAHDEGSTLQTVPLLVLDVYEHAYMIDYGIARAPYIDVFIKNINWDVVNERYAKRTANTITFGV
ncbi:MAG: superoxide dismutase, partial [Vallitaleaceae bacterium]|nr:superoxide dismutase [Vallitaleaceae bacterium]